ncbi:MAG: sigma 54-interacting transcriptional regulator [Desulfatitalea sp.]|nr:sigma 54-interacting transcriptional regulator [Desulfatitalea sp.]NNK00876.1 sigma 54-interacting transcriptional regulator [Desulfatitalea sp.]
MPDKNLVNTLASRENLVRILDNLKEGIIAHDLARRIFFFNAEAERITGYCRDDVLGRDCHEVFGAPFCGQRCSFCDGKPFISDSLAYPLTITAKNGESRCVDFRATMMRDVGGTFVGVLAAFSDETELVELKRRSGEINRFANIIGGDGKMRSVYQQIVDVSQYDFPVHLSGETGTGKELVANAIHNESRRGGAPFVPINCGALPEGLIESELFGHVKGAFSGAIRDKKGRFELADGGTVFLDEVADLPKALQVKLLRFLQEGSFEKVGGERTVHVNARVISATNKDLKKQVQRDLFREDLFYRLNVIPIQIPPLRERKNDIPLLAEHFLHQVAERNRQTPLRLSAAALSIMMDYTWPGNVRELQNAIQFAIVRCNTGTIAPGDLPLELRHFQALSPRKGRNRKLEAPVVRDALTKTGGNKAGAARMLGVGRATLYRFLDEHPELESERP